MKYTTIAFLLSLTLGPLTTSVAADTLPAAAPTIPAAQLQSLQWQSIPAGESTEFELSHTGQALSQPQITGKVLALQLPADRGTLTLRLRSFIENNQVFAPNILILDQQQQPAAFYASNQFSYQPASLMTSDRLEGTIKLAPAPGQKNIYLLIYTTPQDLTRTTVLEGAAKAYAKATGNQPPNIPDPQAKHSTQGHLSLKISSERSSDAITIGNTVATTATAIPTAVPAEPVPTPQTNNALLPDTETYFNHQIQQAVRSGDINRAMTLVAEAERLGSKSARQIFISSIQPRQ